MHGKSIGNHMKPLRCLLTQEPIVEPEMDMGRVFTGCYQEITVTLGLLKPLFVAFDFLFSSHQILLIAHDFPSMSYEFPLSSYDVSIGFFLISYDFLLIPFDSPLKSQSH